MLTILTHSTSPLTLEWSKYHLRKLLRIERGPDAVRESMLRGLRELNIPYRHNRSPLNGKVLVLSGTKALKEAINAKLHGRIDKLIAGPNITVHPYDHDGLMRNGHIDTVLVPSTWIKNYWVAAAPELAPKIEVWPAGVATYSASSRKGPPIIYDKLNDAGLLAEIKTVLNEEVTVFTYGKFSRSYYLKALAQAPYLIYLAKSESQGLALQEAWAHDVPTAVNESGEWRSGHRSWRAPLINAPYLTKDTGSVFQSPNEIQAIASRFKTLHPKLYCDRELSDAACLNKLLAVI